MPSQLVRLYRQIDTCFRSALGRGQNLLIEERIVILHTKERIPGKVIQSPILPHLDQAQGEKYKLLSSRPNRS